MLSVISGYWRQRSKQVRSCSTWPVIKLTGILDYKHINSSTAQAATIAQKIIDARLALTRLRQTHPQPRLTIPLAERKLTDQVTEMQTLDDKLQDISKKVQVVKTRVKGGASEVEKLRTERADIDKAVRVAKVDEDDARLAPLYDWCVYDFF